MEKHEEAEATLQELYLDEKTGAHAATLPGYAFYGATKIAKGEMSKGLEIILSAQRRGIKFQRNNMYVISEFVLGFVYFQILEGKGPKNLLTLAKNFGFLNPYIRLVPNCGISVYMLLPFIKDTPDTPQNWQYKQINRKNCW